MDQGVVSWRGFIGSRHHMRCKGTALPVLCCIRSHAFFLGCLENWRVFRTGHASVSDIVSFSCFELHALCKAADGTLGAGFGHQLSALEMAPEERQGFAVSYRLAATF